MPEQVLHTIKEARAIAILRCTDREVGREALKAAIRGGFHVLEVTMSVPGALDLVRDFAADSGLLVGAGTILTSDQARSAAKAGARFLVHAPGDRNGLAGQRRLVDLKPVRGEQPDIGRHGLDRWQ